ncbi:MAG: HNH endonuclease [Spirochaetia bacterium]|nr:HNH endonuclease [Spirochaetia bacterium]
MNYKKIYDQIIERRKNNPFDGYSESHHIIPRSLGGTNDKSNLVKLSAREHFICHLLLVKIHSSGNNHYKMIRAFLMMLVSGGDHQRFSPSKTYQNFKEKYSLFLKDTYKGEGNSQFGTKWVSNPNTKSSMKIGKSDDIPEGFYLGRNLKWKQCTKCYTNHLLSGVLCSNCKNNFKNTHKQTSPKLRVGNKRTKVEKNCPSCKKVFLTFDGRYCSLTCSKVNGNAAVARKVEDDLGNVFNSLTEASKHYKISVESIRYRIKINRYRYL